jgi:hypothetical protein
LLILFSWRPPVRIQVIPSFRAPGIDVDQPFPLSCDTIPQRRPAQIARRDRPPRGQQ